MNKPSNLTQLNSKPEKISDWDKLVEYNDKHNNKPDEFWIFRGQKESNWGLQSSLERAIAEILGVPKKSKEPEKNDPEYSKKYDDYITDYNNYITKLRTALKRDFGDVKKKKNIYELEFGLLREFQRKCSHHVTDLPKQNHIIEWFALMQHHGAPTRLLDWTYSFFIATYFALKEAEGDCAVWALNVRWIKDIVETIIGKKKRDIYEEDENFLKRTTFKKIFLEDPNAMVLAINPYHLNKRLTVQQGIFLCPGNISEPFEDNLQGILSPTPNFQVDLIKYTIKYEIKAEILKKLHRMNINEASLYPGLDGFARSLKTILWTFPNILEPGIFKEELKMLI